MGYSKQITLADGMFENITAKAFPLVSGGKKNRKIVRCEEMKLQSTQMNATVGLVITLSYSNSVFLSLVHVGCLLGN